MRYSNKKQLNQKACHIETLFSVLTYENIFPEISLYEKLILVMLQI